MIYKKYYFLFNFFGGILFLLAISSCTNLKLNRAVGKSNLNQFQSGIAVTDLETGQLLFQKNADQFFMPASNMKLFTFLLASRTLKEKTPAYFYQELSDSVFVWGAGDASLLHPDFENKQLVNVLKEKNKVIVYAEDHTPKPMGAGWAWDDYTDYYSAEISALPLYGNVVNFKKEASGWVVSPDVFKSKTYFSKEERSSRDRNLNQFYLNDKMKSFQGPFIVSPELVVEILAKETTRPVIYQKRKKTDDAQLVLNTPLDSLLKPMMYFSDNMIAEQLIIQMAAQKGLELETESAIINLQNESTESFLKEVKWVDGSGLSRYNLVRPKDLVAVLNRIYQELPAERWQALLPQTGKSGTLKNIQLSDSGLKIWAKSGSFSNTYNLSGIAITPKGRKLAFSVMTNLANQSVSKSKASVVQFINYLSTF